MLSDISVVDYAKQDLARGLKPSQVYRMWSADLRAAVADPNIGDDAQRLLRSLMLEQTLPWNELEGPDFIDGYTGEIVEDFPEDELDMAMAPVKSDDLSRLASCISPWQAEIAERKPYADEGMNRLFVSANASGESFDEEPDAFDDRGFLPDPIEGGNADQVGTDDYRLFLVKMAPYVDALQTRIDLEAENVGFSSAGAVRRAVRNSHEAREFLGQLNQLAKTEHTPNVATLFLRFQHGLCFEDADAKAVRTKTCSLLTWLIENFADMESGDPADEQVRFNPGDLDAACELLEEQYYAAIPLDTNNPVRSRVWCRAFNEAVIGSATAPAKVAWSTWRKWKSPAGALAYDNAVDAGASPKAAMALFYTEARKAGDIAEPPKTIVALKPNGLVLQGGRFLAWSTAVRVARNEGFVDQDRLAAHLRRQGWGQDLLKALGA